MVIEVSVSLQEQLEIQEFIEFMKSNKMTCKSIVCYNSILYAKLEHSIDFSVMIGFLENIVTQNKTYIVDAIIMKYGVKRYISLQEGVLKQSLHSSTDNSFPLDNVIIDIFKMINDEQVYSALSIVLSLIGRNDLKFYEYAETAKMNDYFLSDSTLIDRICDQDIEINQIVYNSYFDAYVVNTHTPHLTIKTSDLVRSLLDCLNFSYNRLLGIPGDHLRFHYYYDHYNIEDKNIVVLSREFVSINKIFSLTELLNDKNKFGSSFRRWIVHLFLKNRRFIEYKGYDEFERKEAWKRLLRNE